MNNAPVKMIRQKGFSLIELMVAIAIGLLMLALLAVLFSNSSASRMELERVTRLMENARFGIDAVGDDVRHAGYLGPVALPSNTAYTTPSPCVTATANFGFDSGASPIQAPAPLTGIDQPTERLRRDRHQLPEQPRRERHRPRRADRAPREFGSDHDDQCQQRRRVQPVSAGLAVRDRPGHRASRSLPTGPDFDLRTVKCIAGTLAPARRYFARAYYLASCNVCSPSRQHPDPQARRSRQRQHHHDCAGRRA